MTAHATDDCESVTAGKQQLRIQVYLTEEEHLHLRCEAAARGRSLSASVRDILLSHLRHQQDLAGVMDHPGGADPGVQNVLACLERLEDRVIAAVGEIRADVATLADDLQLLAAMVDRLYFGLMVHLPEIPPENCDGAAASADRRHRQWQGHVTRLFRAGGPLAALRRALAGRPPIGSSDVAA